MAGATTSGLQRVQKSNREVHRTNTVLRWRWQEMKNIYIIVHLATFFKRLTERTGAKVFFSSFQFTLSPVLPWSYYLHVARLCLFLQCHFVLPLYVLVSFVGRGKRKSVSYKLHRLGGSFPGEWNLMVVMINSIIYLRRLCRS